MIESQGEGERGGGGRLREVGSRGKGRNCEYCWSNARIYIGALAIVTNLIPDPSIYIGALAKVANLIPDHSPLPCLV